jgi:hypothetical protein
MYLCFMTQIHTILVAPLNLGHGYVTRCITIINGLLKNGYNVLLGSDGEALLLLQQEFPDLETIDLPPYFLNQEPKSLHNSTKVLVNLPHLKSALKKEKKLIKKLVKAKKIQGIISDSRLGIYHKKLPSILITHQLNASKNKPFWIPKKYYKKYLKKFKVYWIPDEAKKLNLSGTLGNSKKAAAPITYIGNLSPLKTLEAITFYDLMVVLNDTEPQRTLLEEKLFEEVKKYNGKVLFIRGKVEKKQEQFEFLNTTVFNFMPSESLELAYNQSAMVLASMDYNTLMDIAKLGKKAYFITSPDNDEQQYLAKRVEKMKLASYCKLKDFSISNLEDDKQYNGFEASTQAPDFESLFSLFKSK